ncbi:hypothetical protein COT75_04460 [Candidatus Beckwithbacteria bacterium CG10_big_fil_rev_8_21_14_0_10_34_10]|uniref:Transcriptional regulator n=1 Tax=Candidatus Beckwithbacteria bacterium CG10_big_fil_rev_8_21_14_0_10_34_10 TaxID=1974495 RepID=A0A2H0WAC2_9BACT|nr:MAG: hypothetical protein COT75_04460 [Candidatus Beckwithbacteria bacterium CG10_big_fil_rev_8_21_14_0_10_34_10]
MNQVQNLKKLSRLSYFDKNTLAQFIELSDNSLYAAINRWVKNGKIIQLKKGFYVTGDYLDKMPEKEKYLEFIANKLKFPSYLSLEYVLQKYSVLSESIFSLTSVTLKSKRVFRNKLGVFIYRGISKNLFLGYTIKKKNEFEIKEATKAKALFDYLYLKLFRVRVFNKEKMDSFRLNLFGFTPKDKKEFIDYCRLTKIKKYQILPRLLFK